MAKWVLEDDCLTPTAKMQISYKGPNPIKLFKSMRPMLEKIFGIGGKDIWERDFRWDTSEDPRGFFIRVCIDKSFDKRSSLFAEIIFQGSQPSDPSKDGKMTVSISGKLKTEYEITSPIYRVFWGSYNRLFYWKVRKGYLDLCNVWLDKTWREFRALLNMPNP